ncbi:phosphatidylserine decarboxylase precursor-related protein [Aequorivita sublithincola DSM 14238]|uniref:Phosphatidylserine decarboxylase-related protein n=1 Tax=Aequorivita sublithincola (strain DSM 14238 / LMG 21431 / ACAM 643 / 9-3) TaxID=746697 RepID=I3YSI8_AEQSU|nr:phosphatidylserine decarboxylase family protein [Aequorivita sublithincola]AFL79956.1 phosphatidylserine decarboxylase precursor-related protein [Aequorivita sublithincola DSM 14238]
MFHKEGFKIIFIALVIVIGLSLLANVFVENPTIRGGVIISLIILLLLVLQFFRNPKRNFLVSPEQVLSSVDGKVVVIEEVFEKEYFNEKRLQVSVFMSPINVHITRYPVAGKVVYSKYHPGKFLVAWHPKSSEENERTTVVVKNEAFGDVLFRQIAGALAKRIVNYAEVNQEVEQASDSGFIKFGSRVDIYLPLDAKVKVTLNQKVKGGISIIAEK